MTTTPDPPARELPWSEVLADSFADVHAIVVVSEDGVHRRRRLYLRAEGAERALRRARAKGERAAVALVRLTPAFIEGTAP